VHHRVPGSFRGRAHLPCPSTGSSRVPHLPRLSRRRQSCAVSAAAARRPPRTGDADAPARMEHRPRPDRAADEAGRGARGEEVEAGVHDEARSDAVSAAGSREPEVHGRQPAPALGLRREGVAATLKAAILPLTGPRYGRVGRWRRPHRADPPLGPRLELHSDGLHRPGRRTRRRPPPPERSATRSTTRWPRR